MSTNSSPSGPASSPPTASRSSTPTNERLLAEALEAGEIVEAGRDRYLAHSHPGDTARSEERTVVATHDDAHPPLLAMARATICAIS